MNRNNFRTESRIYSENGKDHTIKVKYGWHYLQGNSSPHFSITGEIYSGVAGCIHDDIEKRFPELKSLIKWHLCDTALPMHYVANAMYHWERYRGISRWGVTINDPDPLDSFKSTIKFGVLPNDQKELDRVNTYMDSTPIVKRWLIGRMSLLTESMWKEMESFGFNRVDAIDLMKAKQEAI